MKRMIATVVKFPSGALMPHLSVAQSDESVDDPVTLTLMDFVMQANDLLFQVEELMARNDAAQYTPQHPHLPDWGINDINLWLRPPMAQPGHVCITNENTEYHGDEGGQPQQFTYEQFQAAVKHWREFLALIEREGKESLVGRRFEARWPE